MQSIGPLDPGARTTGKGDGYPDINQELQPIWGRANLSADSKMTMADEGDNDA